MTTTNALASRRDQAGRVKELIEILGRPALYPWENRAAFEKLFAQLIESERPSGLSEELNVYDITIFTWEIGRLRRFSSLLVDLQRRSSVERLAGDLVPLEDLAPSEPTRIGATDVAEDAPRGMEEGSPGAQGDQDESIAPRIATTEMEPQDGIDASGLLALKFAPDFARRWFYKDRQAVESFSKALACHGLAEDSIDACSFQNVINTLDAINDMIAKFHQRRDAVFRDLRMSQDRPGRRMTPEVIDAEYEAISIAEQDGLKDQLAVRDQTPAIDHAVT